MNHPLRWESNPERINALKNMTPRELSRRRYDKDGNRKNQTQPNEPVQHEQGEAVPQPEPAKPEEHEGVAEGPQNADSP